MTLEQYYLLVGIIATVVVGLRWAYNKVRSNAKAEVVESVQSKFVYDMATNHLPHVYDALKKIAEKMEVELPDPPPIRFVSFDKKDEN